MWLELWERFGGLVFDSLVSVAFCSKRVCNLVLVLVFGSVVLWMGFTLPLYTAILFLPLKSEEICSCQLQRVRCRICATSTPLHAEYSVSVYN